MTSRRAASSLLALLLGVICAATELAHAAKSQPIFSLKDARGDDHGDGDMAYPLRDDFEVGELDLLELTAARVSGGTEFTAVFARSVRPTARRTIDIGGTSLDSIARFGFYTMNVEIYIDTDRQPDSGSVTLLPGRKAQIDPAFAWEKTVCLVPRPSDARSSLKRLLAKDNSKRAAGTARSTAERKAMIREWVASDLEERFFFPTRVRISGPKMSFFVPDSFLGGAAKPEWAYTVIVTAADVEQRFDVMSALGAGRDPEPSLMVLPIRPGRSRESLGGAREDDPLQSPIVDMLVPPGSSQESILGKDRPDGTIPVILPAVIPQ